jgi:hypothetical protein
MFDHLLCLGICPEEIVFNKWSKGEVAEGKAGHLVRMAEGQAVTYKIVIQVHCCHCCSPVLVIPPLAIMIVIRAMIDPCAAVVVHSPDS